MSCPACLELCKVIEQIRTAFNKLHDADRKTEADLAEAVQKQRKAEADTREHAELAVLLLDETKPERRARFAAEHSDFDQHVRRARSQDFRDASDIVSRPPSPNDAPTEESEA